MKFVQSFGSDWHIADKPTAQGFVAYWSNSGHREALARSGVGRE